MNLPGVLHLGLRYLRRQRGKIILLVSALSLAIILPLGISIFVRQAETHLRARAESTPLMLGAPGSSLELIFNGLYFSKPEIATLPISKIDDVTDLATAIPINARFSADGFRIVGTSLDYFRFRDLEFQAGGQFTRLGDCVIGSEIAKKRGLHPGDAIISSPEAMFDLAGVYPLKMKITGVLAPTGTADDRAVFCDVRTTWIIEGLGHGHEKADPGNDDTVLSIDENGVPRLNASVVEFNEITPENVADFHFHGDTGTFPITAAIVLPRDQKSATILKGRFQDGPIQLADPVAVTDELFATVFQIRDFVVAALIAVGLAAFAISVVVFLLSNRLRAREFSNLKNLGADFGTIRGLIFFETATVTLISGLLAGVILALLVGLAPVIVRGIF